MKLTLAVAMTALCFALCMPPVHAGTRESVNEENAVQGDESEPVDEAPAEPTGDADYLPSDDETAESEEASAEEPSSP